MEQKIKALKTSSKIISIIAKICYTVMIVAVCVCLCTLIFIAITGGEISAFTIGGTNIVFFDKTAATPVEMASICAVLIADCGFLIAIFLLTYRMFHNISLTGDPFIKKHVKIVRAIGILTAIMPVAVGIVESIVTVFAGTDIPEMYIEAPGVAVGAVIFCLSYIIEYGCALKNQYGTDNERTEK